MRVRPVFLLPDLTALELSPAALRVGGRRALPGSGMGELVRVPRYADLIQHCSIEGGWQGEDA